MKNRYELYENDMNYIGFLLMNDNDSDFLLLIFEIFS